MFVRAITKLDNWDEESIDNIKINLLNSWIDSECEYSVFETNSIEDNEHIKNIILRLIIESPNKWSAGFHLLILEDKFLNQLPDVRKDEEKYKCIHGNIIEANYKSFKKCVEYTYLNKANKTLLINCDFGYIGKIISGLTDEEFTWFINQKDAEDKEKNKIVSKIYNIFFKNPQMRRPQYLKTD